ncbi:MAG TPA: AAA family ATPase [Burkholderiales bacterium]|nr:AAA family ATPase [Burkholderiales bacterium]
MTVDQSTIWGGLGAGALIVAAWGQLRMAAIKLVSTVVVRVKIQRPLATAIASYCFKNLRRSPIGLLAFAGSEMFVRPLKRHQLVAYEIPSGETTFFWRGVRPLLLSWKSDGGVDSATLTFIRGTFDADRLVTEAIDYANQSRGKKESSPRRFRVKRYFGTAGNLERGRSETGPSHSYYGFVPLDFRMLKWTPDEVGPELTPQRAIDQLALPTEAQELVTDVQRWLQSEEWYRSRGLPWRRGWLLHGKTGTGKTSIIRAIAQDLDLPVCIFDLSTMTNQDLATHWSDMLTHAPCIALIEDVDAVFHKRKNVAREHGGLSFDCLLNTIGGIETSPGVFLAITTNKSEELDEALGVPVGDQPRASTRPGRIDRILELKAMDEACRRMLAQRILRDSPCDLEQLVREGDGETGAQFQERCARVALEEHCRRVNS